MRRIVRFAEEKDVLRVEAYLKKANLGTDGVREIIDHFLLMEDANGKIAGTLGIEPVGELGLLRSLAISAALSETDILLLFHKMLLIAKEKSLKTLYLATQTAESQAFFECLGFQKIDKERLPQPLMKVSHVQNVFNVDNSLFMEFHL